MSAIPAASVSLRTMADGTLRISFDIEPNNAHDAFRLFASPGTPVAIAALKTGYAAVGGPLTPPKPKSGPLCILACQWCSNEDFWSFADVFNEESAKQFILTICEVESRKELDINSRASTLFEAFIRKPFMRYQKETQ